MISILKNLIYCDLEKKSQNPDYNLNKKEVDSKEISGN